MTVVLVACGLAVAVLLIAAAAKQTRWRRLKYRHALVTLENGAQYDGLITSRSWQLLRLHNARLLLPNAEPVGIDGCVYLERAHVVAYQTGYAP